MDKTIYTEKGAILPLSEGKTVWVKGTGNSMTPTLKSGQVIRVTPIKEKTVLNKGDVVIAKVNGRTYIHLIRAIRGISYQIANNHGHVNGWTTRKNIFGRWEK